MEPVDEMIDILLSTGAIEFIGFEPTTHEPLYKINAEMKTIMPELYKEHLNEVNRDIMRLWEEGFLNVDLLSEDPKVTLTDKAFNDEAIEKISRELQISLLEIKRLLIK